MGNFLENSVNILKLFVRVGRWYMSKCVKKKNQQVELLIFNQFFSPVLGWSNGL